MSQLGLVSLKPEALPSHLDLYLSSFRCNDANPKMSETTTETKPRKLVAISQPISVLPTNIARLYTNIHPILILALYYFCFDSLVADPVSTLKKAIAPLAHLQITYCVVCLPPSSGGSTPAPRSSKTPQKKRVQFAKPPSKKPTPLAARIVVSYHFPRSDMITLIGNAD